MSACVHTQEGSAGVSMGHNHALIIMAFLTRVSNRRKVIINDELKFTNQCQGLFQIITVYDCSNKVIHIQVALYFPHIILNVSFHL